MTHRFFCSIGLSVVTGGAGVMALVAYARPAALLCTDAAFTFDQS